MRVSCSLEQSSYSMSQSQTIESQIPSKIRDSLRRILKDFQTCPQSLSAICDLQHHCFGITEVEIPIPNLLYFLLINVLGFSWDRPWEKIRWAIDFEYGSVACTLADQKFGIHLYIIGVPQDKAERLRCEISGKLQRAMQILERKVLPTFKRDQIRQGNVSLRNNYGNYGASILIIERKPRRLFRLTISRFLIQI